MAIRGFYSQTWSENSFIFICLSEIKLQQSKQFDSDIPPQSLSCGIQRYPKTTRDVLHLNNVLGLFQNLLPVWSTSRGRHPYQMPEPPQRTLFTAKEQRLHSPSITTYHPKQTDWVEVSCDRLQCLCKVNFVLQPIRGPFPYRLNVMESPLTDGGCCNKSCKYQLLTSGANIESGITVFICA